MTYDRCDSAGGGGAVDAWGLVWFGKGVGGDIRPMGVVGWA